MKKTVLVLIVFVSSFMLSAQSIVSYLEQANNALLRGYYDDALEYAEKGLKEEPNNANYYMVFYKSYLCQNNFQAAHEALSHYALKGNCDEVAVHTLLNILEETVKKQKEGTFNNQINELPSLINSERSDYGAFLNENGTKLFFTSSRKSDKAKENIFVSELKNGYYNKPKLLSNLSTNNHESISSIDCQRKIAYISGNYENKDNIMGDIYHSKYDGNSWGTPEKIYSVCSEATDLQPYVFGNTMFFASNRSGGQGGYDLYVSELKDSMWSKPINLGSIVNTNKDEQTPFIDWDGETLYFASNGHPTFGCFDIFRTIKIGNSWTEWKQPENIGLAFNSIFNDRHLYRNNNSQEVYISSDRTSNHKGENIFKVYVDDNFGYSYQICGHTMIENQVPVSAEIHWSYISNGNQIFKEVVSDTTGFYKVRIPRVDMATFLINQKEFFNESDNVYFKEGESEVVKDIYLKKVEARSYHFENINFKINSFELAEESKPNLIELAEKLKQWETVRLCVIGHADDTGSEKYNQKLTEERAKTIYDFLINADVEDYKLTYLGMGEKNPMYPNDSNENRKLNRRVEFQFSFDQTFKCDSDAQECYQNEEVDEIINSDNESDNELVNENEEESQIEENSEDDANINEIEDSKAIEEDKQENATKDKKNIELDEIKKVDDVDDIHIDNKVNKINQDQH